MMFQPSARLAGTYAAFLLPSSPENLLRRLEHLTPGETFMVIVIAWTRNTEADTVTAGGKRPVTPDLDSQDIVRTGCMLTDI